LAQGDLLLDFSVEFLYPRKVYGEQILHGSSARNIGKIWIMIYAQTNMRIFQQQTWGLHARNFSEKGTVVMVIHLTLLETGG
jgi:hypothetical protein